MGTDKRLQRLLLLGQALIDSPRGVALSRYAAQHGHSLSALYRDIGVLEDAGFPIQHEGSRYWLPADFQLLGVRGFSADELLALHAARDLAARLPGSRLEQALGTAVGKLTGAEHVASASAQPGLSLHAFASIDYAPFRDHIARLEEAIARRRVVRLTYRRASTGETSIRDIEPGQLHAEATAEGLYCIAWCRWRQGVRVFAVHRVLASELTNESFRARPELRTRAALRDAFNLWLGDHVVDVVLRFDASIADEIAERRWHPSQVATRDNEQGLELRLRVADPRSLVRWLLSFGPDVQVVEPSSLAAQLRDLHERAGRAPR